MTIVAIARYDSGQNNTQSFQLWENDKLISSHVDNLSELEYKFEASVARPTISFDGKYAAFSIMNGASDEYTRIDKTMVLSDTGDFFEVGFDQTISEAEISRKTSFTPDGYLYNYYSTQRCKIGNWTVEPSGLPKGEMTVDAANNIIFIVSNNRSNNVTIRAFYIDSLIETDMPINLTDDITGSESYYVDLAVSPAGNGIDVLVIPYEGYDSPPYEPTKKIFFGLHSKSKWSAIQMFPHETRHGNAGAMSAFSTDGTILARYFNTRDRDKEFGTVTTINAITGKFIGSSEIPNTIGMTSPVHKDSFYLPLAYPVQLDNTPIFYGQFPYQPSWQNSAVIVNAIDIFTRELRPTSFFPMPDSYYYIQLRGIAAQPKISTFQHRNNFWDRFVFTEETLD